MTSSVVLSAPAGNGVGPAADVSDLGHDKTVVASGDWRATVIIEGRQTASGPWVLLAHIPSPGRRSVRDAVAQMRVRVSGYRSGTIHAAVGGDGSGGKFVDLPVPATDGAGAAVDVSGLGSRMTAIVGGPFDGAAFVEISQDGVDWGQAFRSFSGGGHESRVVAASWARVRREGTTQLVGAPTVSLGATNDKSALGSYDATELVTSAGPKIIAGSPDPAATGVAAPVGSLYLRDNGTHWKKDGGAAADWSQTVGSGVLELVSHVVVSGSATQTLALASGLPGNAVWRIIGRLLIDVDGEDIYLNPNGVTANQKSGYHYTYYGGGNGNTVNEPRLMAARSGASSNPCATFFDGILVARDGLQRTLSVYNSWHTDARQIANRDIRGIWQDTADVSSLELESATGAHILVGSEVWVYQVRASN